MTSSAIVPGPSISKSARIASRKASFCASSKTPSPSNGKSTVSMTWIMPLQAIKSALIMVPSEPSARTVVFSGYASIFKGMTSPRASLKYRYGPSNALNSASVKFDSGTAWCAIKRASYSSSPQSSETNSSNWSYPDHLQRNERETVQCTKTLAARGENETEEKRAEEQIESAQ